MHKQIKIFDIGCMDVWTNVNKKAHSVDIIILKSGYQLWRSLLSHSEEVLACSACRSPGRTSVPAQSGSIPG